MFVTTGGAIILLSGFSNPPEEVSPEDHQQLLRVSVYLQLHQQSRLSALGIFNNVMGKKFYLGIILMCIFFSELGRLSFYF